jgi:hypothetical protein
MERRPAYEEEVLLRERNIAGMASRRLVIPLFESEAEEAA